MLFYTGKEINKKEYEEKSNNIFTKKGVVIYRNKYYTKTFLEYQKASNMKFDDKKYNG